MYDIDNNGYLDKNDFECLAVRTTVIESKGDFSQEKYDANRKVMQSLWNEIADLADFNKDGMVTKDEFKEAVQNLCVGKPYAEFPHAMKAFIGKLFDTIDLNDHRAHFCEQDGQVSVDEFKSAVKNACVGKPFESFPAALRAFISSHFSTVDVNGDGLIGIEEYRVDCCSRAAYADIKELDDAYEKLCSPEDKKKGGIDVGRFQELYSQFIGNPDETIGACYLFGPLSELS